MQILLRLKAVGLVLSVFREPLTQSDRGFLVDYFITRIVVAAINLHSTLTHKAL